MKKYIDSTDDFNMEELSAQISESFRRRAKDLILALSIISEDEMSQFSR
jgi:hypothetical protein